MSQVHCPSAMQCWASSSLTSAPLPAGIGVTRGSMGSCSPQIFRTYSHLCFERGYHKQNSVIRLKSNIFSPTKSFASPKRLGWLRYCLQEQVAKLARGLFYCWSLSCNNNMATDFQMFTPSYNITRFLACDSWTQTSRQVMQRGCDCW